MSLLCVSTCSFSFPAEQLRLTEIIVGLVGAVVVVLLIAFIAYVLIFHLKKIKVCLQPHHYCIPDHVSTHTAALCCKSGTF